MKYILGFDLGTSSLKGIICSTKGDILKEYNKEYDIIQPKNGWAEQDVNIWRKSFFNLLDDISKEYSMKDIVAIGSAGQMHGLVALDENNEVVRNAIIWCDQRTIQECEDINKIVSKKVITKITCNEMLPGFTLPKLMWIKKNEPNLYKKIKHILLPKDYLNFLLTNKYCSDVSDASGTGMFDVINRKWSQEIIDKLNIDYSILPTVYESQDSIGCLSDEIIKKYNFSKDTIVIAGTGDNAGAAIGAGVYKDNTGFVTIGTSGVVFVQTDKPKFDEKGRIHTFCSAVKGTWHVMGVHQASGLSLSWFKNNLGDKYKHMNHKDIYDLIIEEAHSSPIGANKLIYLPYLMGERTPHLDGYARGVFFGLSAMHNLNDMARSVIEGISFSLKDSVQIMNNLNIMPNELVLCGGGAKNKLLGNMLTDILNSNTKSLITDKGPSVGVCILAGVSANIFSSVEQGVEAIVKYKNNSEPTSNDNEYNKYYEIYKSLYPALKENFKNLNNI